MKDQRTVRKIVIGNNDEQKPFKSMARKMHVQRGIVVSRQGTEQVEFYLDVNYEYRQKITRKPKD